MSTMIYTARRADLSEKMVSEVAEALAKSEFGDVFVVVPNQLTLETEAQLIDELKLEGSFRLNVVSPKRLCERLFEECGRPAAAVIDERGRAMLMGYLLKQNENRLICYASSASHAGFESRLVEEISHFRQAGIDSEALSALAENGMSDRMRAKIHDLSLLYGEYEIRLGDAVQDGEQEISEAVKRMPTSAVLKNSFALVYGFDITTPTVNLLIAGLGAVCPECRIFIPLPPETEGDGAIYEPQRKALSRLQALLSKQGIPFRTVPVLPSRPIGGIESILRRLYAVPADSVPLDGADISACQCKNPLDEARFAAASIRELVRLRGYNYRDISVIVQGPEAYEDVISCAFREYEVPYFLQSAMKAATHPLCRFLIESLRLLTGRSSGIGALCETGFTELSQDEQEALTEYSQRLNLRPSALLKPFTRGSSEMIETAEPLRQKLVGPLTKLRDELKGADSLSNQLKSIYAYLSDTNCFEKYNAYIDELKAAGEVSLAQDDVRIGNLLMDTFDQMNELLGPKPLSMSALSDLIQRALDAVVVRVLPQSPDAVSVTSPQRCGMRPVKAVFLLHAVMQEPSEQSGIFDDSELSLLSQKADKYLAPSLFDLARTDRMYVKDALCLASESVRISFPSGAMDGSALMSGTVISELKRLIKDFKPKGGVDGDEGAHVLRLSSEQGALNFVSSDFGHLPEDAPVATAVKLMAERGQLEKLRHAASYTNRSETLQADLAKKLYFKGTSVSRLERYAACPFAHFVEHGLRPQRQQAFRIDPLNRGILLHECVELFMKAEGIEAGSEEDAVRRMGEIFDQALKGKIAPYAADSNAALFQVKTLKRASQRAAVMLYRQLKTGVFHPIDVEVGFGRDGKRFLKLREVELDGRIDRVDLGVHGGEKYVFVVDYKSGFKKLEPAQILAGLQLQLLIYLAVAMDRYDARSAGVYYFRISDDPVRSDSTDPDSIEDKRIKALRMAGIAPDDAGLLKDIADEPQKILQVDFTSSGALSKSVGIQASQSEFDLLIGHALEQCRRFSESVLSGDTAISPAVSSSFDACKYCDYADICLKDGAIRGISKRKLSSLKFGELIEKLQ